MALRPQITLSLPFRVSKTQLVRKKYTILPPKNKAPLENILTFYWYWNTGITNLLSYRTLDKSRFYFYTHNPLVIPAQAGIQTSRFPGQAGEWQKKKKIRIFHYFFSQPLRWCFPTTIKVAITQKIIPAWYNDNAPSRAESLLTNTALIPKEILMV